MGLPELLQATERLLTLGNVGEALAVLEAGAVGMRDPSERLALANQRLRILLSLDRDADAIAPAYAEAIAAADAAPEDGVRRRVAYRKALALHLVVKGKPVEAERLALEALGLLSLGSAGDYMLLNVISMHSARPGEWAMPFARRAVEVADAEDHHGLGLASRLAVARHLWVAGRRDEAEAQFEALLAFAREHDGHVAMAVYSIEEIRAGRPGKGGDRDPP